MVDESRQSQRAMCAVLNGLIVACENDVLVYLAGARIVSNADTLLGRVETRRMFVRQLSSVVIENGGRPRKGGSTAQHLRILFREGRDLLGGSNSGDVYRDSANVEGKAERIYADALAGDLPIDVRALIERHHDEIARDGEMFRRKRFLS